MRLFWYNTPPTPFLCASFWTMENGDLLVPGAAALLAAVVWLESRRLAKRAKQLAQIAAVTQNFREVETDERQASYNAHRPAVVAAEYEPAEPSFKTDPIDPALMANVVGKNRALFAGLNAAAPIAPALICAGGMIRRSHCSTLPLGASSAADVGFGATTHFTVEVRPGFELVASDGELEQLWIGPVTDVSNHETFAPTMFVARKSSPASEWRRSRLPVRRVTKQERALGQMGGEISEITEQQLDFVDDRNADLSAIHAAWSSDNAQ